MPIARGELEETGYLLILGRALGYVKEQDFERATAACDRVGKLMNALGTSLKHRLYEN